MQESLVKTETTSRKRINSKSFQFEVKIAPLDAYPDLKNNPTNLYALMSDEERLEDLIETLGVIWAETCRESGQTGPDAGKENGKAA